MPREGLVNQVARISGEPGVAVVDSKPVSATERSGAERDSAARLQRESPVVSREGSRDGSARQVVAERPVIVAGSDGPLPPLENVQNPLLEMRAAAAEANQDPQVGRESAPAGSGIPTAVLVDAPAGSALLEAHNATGGSQTLYTVRKGDNLSKICKAFYTDRAADGQTVVLAANPQLARRPGRSVLLGEELRIPPLTGSKGVIADIGGMEASGATETVVKASEAKPAAPQPKGARAASTVASKTKSSSKRDKAVAGTGNAARSAQTKPKAAAGGAKVASNEAKSRSGKASAAPKSSGARRSSKAETASKSAGKRATSLGQKDARRADAGVHDHAVRA
ncbi:MAG: hypothetical protein HZB38_04655 [Planctomycetes bacterium]|nr:hypothetical protein [Planctomycetota bacterium]